MNRVLKKRSVFVSWTYLCLISFMIQTPFAWAVNSSSGAGGSITMDAVDPTTGNPIPDNLLHPGMPVRLVVHAFDPSGNPMHCTPTFRPNQGVAGNQIQEPIEVQADGSGLMTMGTGFGSAEVIAQCQELPDVTAKMPVANNTLTTTNPFAKPKPLETPPAEKMAETPAAETAAPTPHGPSGAGILLGVAAGVGVAALVVSMAAKNSTPCTAPSLYCKGPELCCPSGKMYYCQTPANVAGCYSDVFITGCTLKVFCTSEY